MTAEAFDPEILQDFLTESGELLEQVEADLVELESRPHDLDLLNQIFRALHTIKGSASFLAFAELVEIAHAAETALNAARNQEVSVTSTEMDLLLRAVDVIKAQFGEIQSGGACTSAAEPALVADLSAIGSGQPPSADADAAPKAQQPDDAAMLELPDSKLDLLEPLTADVEDSIGRIRESLPALAGAGRAEIAASLPERCDTLAKTIEFFEIPETTALVGALTEHAQGLDALDDDSAALLAPCLDALCALIETQNAALRDRVLRTWDIGPLVERIGAIRSGETLNDGHEHADAEELLAVLGIVPAQTEETDGAGAQSGQVAAKQSQGVGHLEQTIRVDVERLEELMNLVGELVLQKNRVLGLSEAFERRDTDSTLQEQLELTAGVLDRITGDIQIAVMRTRMQPLNKLLGKYPRLIRDLAAKTDKEIALVIEGGETEVDKTVIEELGDPLVHLLRNSADHGIEPPEERRAAGKDPRGSITIRAAHAGSHVRIQVIDDGRGLDRERIGAKAVERGIVSADQLESMPDEEVYRLILAAGFSTAENVSDISGRGVGMDVVRTNIESKLNGQLTIESEKGAGTTLNITIPLTLAIMPAMMVAVGEEVYAIPLGNIDEIVRPAPDSITSIGGYPVVHLRGSVIPLLSGAEALGAEHGSTDDEPFVVLVQHASRTVGLRVTRVIGQQEIVMKPLDGLEREGPISGATIRNNGSVSLIVDVARLMASASMIAQTVANHENHENHEKQAVPA